MFECEHQGKSCLENDYYKFDDVAKHELADAPTVEEIVNLSEFCTCLTLPFIEGEESDGLLKLTDYLKKIRNKVGVYHLWIDVGYCQDHGAHSLLCVYVGKGNAVNRLVSHAREKWPQNQPLYISFYECENRLAKYIEELFLDAYEFYLNVSENNGSGYLYARWDKERFEMQHEIEEHADILDRKYGSGLEDIVNSWGDENESEK
ncbi:hypothetical protein [Vreelandella hamiltonii]|uniref:GIY-YIG domain-containing protein n=1 Tax=Halomonas johnsoniae TaxID=502832 RepID=A0ABQ2WMJ5_9GAMM|nr:hypothetical protein [Halomonas johnsoniae]GGW62524.1 hypothetical protein GCM10007158_24200 [Halomonas johnsoniae]